MSDAQLLPGERIDDLQREGFRIIQNPDKFCFGMDAVLLSDFTHAGCDDRIMDLCSGNGVIPILLAARGKGREIIGLELQSDIVGMAERSIRLNDIQDRVRIDAGDIKDAVGTYGAASFDVVTANPPYMNEHHGLTNPDDALAIARHEIKCNLTDVISAAAGLLKSGGHFFMVHRPHRLVEIFAVMQSYRLEPKRMRLVYPTADAEAKMVLIEGVRSGGAWLKVERPLIIYDRDGSYTEEIRSIYED